MTLRVLKTLKILPGSLSQGGVVSVDCLLYRRVDPGVVVLVEFVSVGVSVRGPGHAHRPHHVTRGVHPGSGLITGSLSDQYSSSHAHHNVTLMNM